MFFNTMGIFLSSRKAIVSWNFNAESNWKDYGGYSSSFETG